jgi:hypothetical protein
MSKERELLESCLDEMQYHSLDCPELVLEIQELLAQPEQEPKIEFRGLLLNGGSYSQASELPVRAVRACDDIGVRNECSRL